MTESATGSEIAFESGSMTVSAFGKQSESQKVTASASGSAFVSAFG